jgi:hypothetical protein
LVKISIGILLTPKIKFSILLGGNVPSGN